MVDQHTLLYTEGQDSAIWQLDITTGHKDRSSSHAASTTSTLPPRHSSGTALGLSSGRG
jgi:hypothetical protein